MSPTLFFSFLSKRDTKPSNNPPPLPLTRTTFTEPLPRGQILRSTGDTPSLRRSASFDIKNIHLHSEGAAHYRAVTHPQYRGFPQEIKIIPRDHLQRPACVKASRNQCDGLLVRVWVNRSGRDILSVSQVRLIPFLTGVLGFSKNSLSEAQGGNPTM